jgi:hypothetical protein
VRPPPPYGVLPPTGYSPLRGEKRGLVVAFGYRSMAGAIGYRQSCFVGAPLMSVIALTWMPARRLARRVGQRGEGR